MDKDAALNYALEALNQPHISYKVTNANRHIQLLDARGKTCIDLWPTVGKFQYQGKVYKPVDTTIEAAYTNIEIAISLYKDLQCQ